jgi:hypothetical protein
MLSFLEIPKGARERLNILGRISSDNRVMTIKMYRLTKWNIICKLKIHGWLGVEVVKQEINIYLSGGFLNFPMRKEYGKRDFRTSISIPETSTRYFRTSISIPETSTHVTTKLSHLYGMSNEIYFRKRIIHSG